MKACYVSGTLAVQLLLTTHLQVGLLNCILQMKKLLVEMLRFIDQSSGGPEFKLRVHVTLKPLAWFH